MVAAMNCAADGICRLRVTSFLTGLWDSQCPAQRLSQIISFARIAVPVLRANSWRRRWMHRACTLDSWRAELSSEEKQIFSRRMTVGVFWDLDNKPPALVPPYDAAMRLRNLATELGEVVEMVAYANRNAFTYVPGWVREQRQERRLLDQLEIRGLVSVERPYFCKLCHRMCRTNVALRRHFKQVHERERKGRLAFLKTLKGKRREKFLGKIAELEVKYKEAAKRVLFPKSGYGLGSDLKRAGVDVRTVESKPQAADEALKKHINFCMNKGVECICLVSDDSDFLGILKTAKRKGLKVVIVGDAYALQRAADASFSWEDVASGRYFHQSTMKRWVDDHAWTEETFSPDKDDDYGHVNSNDESQYFESVENVICAIRTDYGYQDEETCDEDSEYNEGIRYEDGASFSESDDDDEYLANLRKMMGFRILDYKTYV